MNLSAGQEWRLKVQNRLMDTAWKGEGGTNWESSIEIYTLPCIKQMANGEPCLLKAHLPSQAMWEWLSVMGEEVVCGCWRLVEGGRDVAHFSPRYPGSDRFVILALSGGWCSRPLLFPYGSCLLSTRASCLSDGSCQLGVWLRRFASPLRACWLTHGLYGFLDTSPKWG